MKRFASVAIAALAALLSGCVPQQEQLRQEYLKELSGARSVCAEKLKTTDIDPIRNKLTIETGQDASLAMLTDNSFASDEEKVSIAVLDTIHNDCTGLVIEVLKKYLPSDYSALAQEFLHRTRHNKYELYSNKISFGQYNMANQSANLALAKTISELDSKYQEVIQRQQAAVAQQQAAQSQQLMNALGAMYMINQAAQPRYTAPAPRMPMRTNCNTYGVSTNCTTW